MTWYALALGWLAACFIWLELGAIRRQLERIADAVEPRAGGSSYYGNGGLRDIAKAIRERHP